MPQISDQDYNDLMQKLQEALNHDDQDTAKKIGDYINSVTTPKQYGPSKVDEYLQSTAPAYRNIAKQDFAAGHLKGSNIGNEMQAASQGALPERDTPGNLISSLSPNASSRMAIYEKALTKQYGQPIKVEVGENGSLVYADPSGKYHMIASSMSQNAGTAIPAAGQAIAATKLGVVPGAIMSGIGEGARLTAGHVLGADTSANEGPMGENSPYSKSQILGDAAMAGGESLAAGAAFPLLARVRSFYGFLRTGQQPWSQEMAKELLDGSAKSQALVDKIRAMSPDAQGFNPTLAQMSNSRMGLNAQKALEINPSLGADLRAQQAGTNQALNAAFKAAQEDAGMTPWDPINGGPGQGLIDKVQAIKQQRVAQAKTDLNGAQQSLNDLFDRLPKTTQYKVIQTLGPEVNKGYTSLQDSTAQAYLKRNELQSKSPNIPRDAWNQGAMKEMYDSLKEWRARTNDAWTAAQRAQLKGLTPNLPGRTPPPDVQLMQDLGLGGDEAGMRTVKGFDDYISFLREVLRRKGKNVTNPPDMATVKRMEESAVMARQEWLGQSDPALLQATNDAETARFNEGNYLRNALAKGFLRKAKAGGVEIAQGGLMSSILNKGDVGMAKELYDTVKGDPQAVDALNQFSLSYIKSMFKEDFGSNANLTAAGWNKVSNKIDVLKEWSPEAVGAMNDAQYMGQEVWKYKKKLDMALDTFNDSFAGRIQNLNGEGVSKALFSDPSTFGVSDILKLKKLSKGLGAYEGMSQQAGNDLARQVTGREGTEFNVDALNKLLDDPNQVAKWRSWFGYKYVENLQTIKEAGNMAARKSSEVADLPSERSTWSDIARFVYAHPLTAEGRFLTLMTGMRKKEFAKAVTKGLTDPEYLEGLVNLSKFDLNSQKAARAAAGLNIVLQSGGQDWYGDVGTKKEAEAQ